MYKFMGTTEKNIKSTGGESTGIQNITVGGALDKVHSIGMTLPKVRESNTAWYVTKEGKVFNANGYVYNGKTYFTGAIYQNSVLPSNDSTNSVRAKKIYEKLDSGRIEITDVPETNTYTVTFDSNGGNDIASITGLVEGAKISKPTDPELTGKVFEGWYKEVGLANSFDFDNDTISSNITLYAKWENSIIGTEVSFNNENFFVISKDSVNGTLDILAKYCLNSSGTAQLDNTATYQTYGVPFCTGNISVGGYWKSISGITYPYDLDSDAAIERESTRATVIRIVDKYGIAKGGVPARLMKYSEAVALYSSIGDILAGKWGTETDTTRTYAKFFILVAWYSLC